MQTPSSGHPSPPAAAPPGLLPNGGLLWRRPVANSTGAFRKHTALLLPAETSSSSPRPRGSKKETSVEGGGGGVEGAASSQRVLRIRSNSVHFPFAIGATDIALGKHLVQIIPAYVVRAADAASGTTTAATAKGLDRFPSEQAYFALAPRKRCGSAVTVGGSAASKGAASPPDAPTFASETYLFRARSQAERDRWVALLTAAAAPATAPRQTEGETWPFGKAGTTEDVAEADEGPTIESPTTGGVLRDTQPYPAAGRGGLLVAADTGSIDGHYSSGEDSGLFDSDDSSRYSDDDGTGSATDGAAVPRIALYSPDGSILSGDDGSAASGSGGLQSSAWDAEGGPSTTDSVWDDLCHDHEFLQKTWDGAANVLRARRAANRPLVPGAGAPPAKLSAFAESVLSGLSLPATPVAATATSSAADTPLSMPSTSLPPTPAMLLTVAAFSTPPPAATALGGNGTGRGGGGATSAAAASAIRDALRTGAAAAALVSITDKDVVIAQPAASVALQVPLDLIAAVVPFTLRASSCRGPAEPQAVEPESTGAAAPAAAMEEGGEDDVFGLTIAVASSASDGRHSSKPKTGGATTTMPVTLVLGSHVACARLAQRLRAACIQGTLALQRTQQQQQQRRQRALSGSPSLNTTFFTAAGAAAVAAVGGASGSLLLPQTAAGASGGSSSGVSLFVCLHAVAQPLYFCTGQLLFAHRQAGLATHAQESLWGDMRLTALRRAALAEAANRLKPTGEAGSVPVRGR